MMNCGSELRQLAAAQADIWLVAPDSIGADLLRSYEALMDASERGRWERFAVPKPRLIHLVARALLRTTLSRYAGVGPAEWRFTTNDYGRPYIAAPAIGRDLRFNLSHTDGLVAVVVAEGREVGIDVEHRLRRLDTDRLAPAVFEASELRAYQSAPEEQRREVFYALWTLKEAYIKARGMGLSLPLDGFAFDISSDPPHIRFNRRCFDDASRWQFRRHSPTPDHALAVAVAVVAREAPVDIRLVWSVPLHRNGAPSES